MVGRLIQQAGSDRFNARPRSEGKSKKAKGKSEISAVQQQLSLAVRLWCLKKTAQPTTIVRRTVKLRRSDHKTAQVNGLGMKERRKTSPERAALR
jgi:hypothetical protein